MLNRSCYRRPIRSRRHNRSRGAGRSGFERLVGGGARTGRQHCSRGNPGAHFRPSGNQESPEAEIVFPSSRCEERRTAQDGLGAGGRPKSNGT